MGVRVTGMRDVQEMLYRLDSNGKRRVVATLYRAAQDMVKLARAMAPRDLSNLEKAIKMRPEQLGVVRDAYGRFTRTEIEVYIDGDMAADGRKAGTTVGDYAYEIHEHLEPYGLMQLGEASRAKQRGSSVKVGGGFMERAAQEIEAGIDRRLIEVLDELGF